MRLIPVNCASQNAEFNKSSISPRRLLSPTAVSYPTDGLWGIRLASDNFLPIELLCELSAGQNGVY